MWNSERVLNYRWVKSLWNNNIENVKRKIKYIDCELASLVSILREEKKRVCKPTYHGILKRDLEGYILFKSRVREKSEITAMFTSLTRLKFQSHLDMCKRISYVFCLQTQANGVYKCSTKNSIGDGGSVTYEVSVIGKSISWSTFFTMRFFLERFFGAIWNIVQYTIHSDVTHTEVRVRARLMWNFVWGSFCAHPVIVELLLLKISSQVYKNSWPG